MDKNENENADGPFFPAERTELFVMIFENSFQMSHSSTNPLTKMSDMTMRNPVENVAAIIDSTEYM